MSDLNTKHNRVVWFDLPVADLDRACTFYRSVLAIEVRKEKFEHYEFAVLEHADGNGGCLVPGGGGSSSVNSEGGVLIYLNAAGRIRAATEQVQKLGGRVVEPIHSIGPHGFRAIIIDSEGNRLALHSPTDA